MHFLARTGRHFFPYLLIALSLLVAIPLQSAAAEGRLRVRAVKHRGASIVLRVRLGAKPALKQRHRKVRAARAILTLERSVDDAPFSLLAVRTPSRRRVRLHDTAVEPSVYAYRALIQRGAKQRVSSTSSVFVSDSDLGVEPEATPEPEPSPPAIGNPSTPIIPEGYAPCSEAELSDMFTRTNFYREQNGVAVLSKSALLESAAIEHSLAMATSGVFSHDGWLERLVARGFTYGTAAQNIAYYIQNALEVTDALYGSAGHRYNMLNASHQLLGVACIRDPQGIPWWTQYFATFR